VAATTGVTFRRRPAFTRAVSFSIISGCTSVAYTRPVGPTALASFTVM
jgi:hypothetical protein